ncbi:MAG TPA: response regulator [Terriglobales bacterium]|nr:response regulator [Terriglobales bacterium]
MSLILWIDDDTDQLRLYSELLWRAGFHVITATNATAGLDLFARNPVDLVVSDQHLRDGTTINVVAELKRVKPTVPVIVFSGSLEVPTGIELADLSVTKGAVSPKELIAEIARLLTKA